MSEHEVEDRSTPVVGPLSVTPLYRSSADAAVWWDGAAWEQLPGVSGSVGGGVAQQLAVYGGATTVIGDAHVVETGLQTWINYSTGGVAAPVIAVPPMLLVTGPNAAVSNITTLSYGSQSSFTVANVGGSAASPAAVSGVGNQLGNLNFCGFDGTQVAQGATIRGHSAETNWGTGAHGTYLELTTTLAGTTGQVARLRIENDGGLMVANPASTVTGGSRGAGTINVSGGYYVNGGPLPPAQLGTGTANTGTWLRGDGTWQPQAGGGNVTGSGLTVNQLVIGQGGSAIAGFAPGAANTVLHSGTPPTWAQVSLTTDVTGILPPANLGSGVNAGYFLRGDGTWQPVSGSGTVAAATAANQLAFYLSPTASVSGNTHLSESGSQTLINYNASANAATNPSVGGALIRVTALDTGLARIAAIGYGANGSIMAAASGGNGATPAAWSTTASVMGGFEIGAWDGVAANITPSVNIVAFATQAPFSSTTHAARAEIRTTPANSTALAPVMGWESNGGITVPPSVTGGGIANGINVSGGYYVNGGPIPPAQLGTGTPSTANYLRGDGSWQPVAGGGADTVTPGITAHAGGGQALAAALPSQFNVVTIVATGGDSVVLPVVASGMHCLVRNSGANPLAVFPPSGVRINTQALNAAITVVANSTAYFEADAAQWYSVP